MFGAIRRFVHGRTEQREQVRFAVVATAALLAIALVNYVLFSPDWWDHRLQPLAIGVVVLAGGTAGFREHGLVHAAVPPYVFTASLLLTGDFFLRTGGRQFPIRLAVVAVLAPLFLSLPFVLIGYLLGFAATELSGDGPVRTDD